MKKKKVLKRNKKKIKKLLQRSKHSVSLPVEVRRLASEINEVPSSWFSLGDKFISDAREVMLRRPRFLLGWLRNKFKELFNTTPENELKDYQLRVLIGYSLMCAGAVKLGKEEKLSDEIIKNTNAAWNGFKGFSKDMQVILNIQHQFEDINLKKEIDMATKKTTTKKAAAKKTTTKKATTKKTTKAPAKNAKRDEVTNFVLGSGRDKVYKVMVKNIAKTKDIGAMVQKVEKTGVKGARSYIKFMIKQFPKEFGSLATATPAKKAPAKPKATPEKKKVTKKKTVKRRKV